MNSMTGGCGAAAGEQVALYFYGELAGSERRAFEQHLATCEACTAAVSDLELLRAALAARAEAPARSDEEWAGFMRRLDARLNDRSAAGRGVMGNVAWLAMAASLVAAIGAGLTWQRQALRPTEAVVATAATVPADGTAFIEAAAARHFDRARLVLLGIATKDPSETSADDWAYERQLAASLLPETRLFRQSAAERGDARLAGLLADLETVLLQASMSTDAEVAELERLQRVIRRRDLVGRMELQEL